MRRNLAADEGERRTFIATCSRFGKKINFKGRSEDTILFVDVRDAETGTLVTDHIWFTFSKAFEKVNLREGMTIRFDARVKSYSKGYVNRKVGFDQRRKDLKLSHPTRIHVV